MKQRKSPREEAPPEEEGANQRKKREVLYTPILVRCKCLDPLDKCVPVRNPLERDATVCMCFEDSLSGNIWPCYPAKVWTEEYCTACTISNSCPYPIDRRNISGELRTPCLCQDVSNFCMIRPEGPVKWWNPFMYSTHKVVERPATVTTTVSPRTVEALEMEVSAKKGSFKAIISYSWPIFVSVEFSLLIGTVM